MKRIKIALVGDFDEKMHTHIALNQSIDHCKPHLSFDLEAEWISTVKADDLLFNASYNGIWITPGSPYKNDKAVFDVIRYARENNVPITGSCGGFQYMILEYAKNVLKIEDAGHAETEPQLKPVISKLACSLKGEQEQVYISDKSSWLYEVLNTDTILGKYYCSYGINPNFQDALHQFPLVFSAYSPTGEVRAFELKGHRFFKGTLFQPPLDSTMENPNPLIINFFKACN